MLWGLSRTVPSLHFASPLYHWSLPLPLFPPLVSYTLFAVNLLYQPWNLTFFEEEEGVGVPEGVFREDSTKILL